MLHGPVPVAVALTPTRSGRPRCRAADAFQAIGAVGVPPSTVSVNVPPLALPAVTSQVPVVADSVEPPSMTGATWVSSEPSNATVTGTGVKAMLHGPVPVAVA